MSRPTAGRGSPRRSADRPAALPADTSTRGSWPGDRTRRDAPSVAVDLGQRDEVRQDVRRRRPRTTEIGVAETTPSSRHMAGTLRRIDRNFMNQSSSADLKDYETFMTYAARTLVTSEEVQCRCRRRRGICAREGVEARRGFDHRSGGRHTGEVRPAAPARAHFQRAGMGVSPSWSVFCVDSGIAFTPTIGVDGDLRIRIDPADLRLVDDGVAWAPGNLTDQQGSPRPCACARCSRAPNRPRARTRSDRPDRRRARVHDAVGATPATRPPIPGRPTACAPRWTARRSWSTSPTPPSAPGCAIEQIHTEYGHDQLEVSLAPSTPVAAADAVIAGPHRDRPGGRRHGLRISFSPVPFEGEAGNGAHLHLSLADDDGPAVLRRRRAARHAARGRVRDRRRADRPAGPAWRLRGFGAVVGAAEARQLGGRRAVLGPGEPRGRGAIHRGDTGQPARRQHRAEAHRPQRQPLPGGRGVPRQRAARHRQGTRAAAPKCPRTRPSAADPPPLLPTDQRAGDRGAGVLAPSPPSCCPRGRSRGWSRSGATRSPPTATGRRPKPPRRCAWHGAADH